MKRKILSLILVFAMTVSLLTVGTGAVEPTYGDTAGHWAESSIERWSGHGIIQGSNGLFDPNGQLTCAQLATILAKLLKLPAAKDAGFTDNTADAWYYDAINRCAAAGILNGNGDGTVTPEAPITRERAMVMLARALGIEPIRKPDLTKYTDAAQVSAYAQGYVAALIEAGIVGGVTADELAPQDNINRASTVTILDRAISTYADKAGATVKADGKGLVLVVAENVKITGAPEGTKIVVADGATGLTVNGKSVSDDQTYIVPKAEPAKPSGGSSSGGSSHSHTISDEWSYDDTYHWHEASCGREAHRSGKSEHTYNGSNVCTVCGQVNPTVTVAKIGDKNYATLADAMTYAVNNDTIVLVKPETITSAVFAENKSVTLDLNGQTLTANVEDGKAAIQVDGSNAALTIKDSGGSGKIISTSYGIYALNDASVTVESGTIESLYCPLAGNNTTGSMNFTVKGGTLTAQKGPAIYMPGQVELVITDGTLNGGISLRMGQVNISGGTINAVTSDIDAPSSYYNYSGNAWLPDALYVFGGTYDNGDADHGNSLNLTITGGTFNCANGQGSAVAIYDLGKVAQTMNVNISGNAVLTTTATSREAYQVLSLSDIGVTSPAGGYGNTEYTGKVSSAITGGTFSSDPSAYVAEGYITLVNGGTFTVSNTNEIPVTNTTAQDYLDGKYGSINGKTLVLASGNYSALKLAPTAYAGSNTTYTCPHNDSTDNTGPVTFTSVVGYKQHMRDNPHHGTARIFTRTLNNLTITAQNGAEVTIAGFEILSRTYHGDSDPFAVGKTGYEVVLNVKNLTFSNVKFTAKVEISSAMSDTIINGVTFNSCVFETEKINNTNKQALNFSNDLNNGKVTNLKVDECKFNNCYQGVYTNTVKNILVTSSEFSGTFHNAIAVQTGNDAVNHGAVVISGNTFTDIGDRIIRFNNVGADTQITITHNTATNCNAEKEAIKAESLDGGVTYTISGNNWGNAKAPANDQLKDSLTSPM